MTERKKKVLFVCVENSNRSQMAEAFARLHGSDIIEAYSAGSRPSGIINPKAITAMREKGVDLTLQRSIGLNELPDVEWDHVVTMGCGDECPFLRAKHRDDWAIPDPRAMSTVQFNEVRDEIERRIVQFVDSFRNAR